MLVPVLALLAVLSLFPFFYIIWMSLNIVSLINGISFDFASLANWTRMFTDEIVGAAWARAALYIVATVGLELVLGIAIALLVHELVWGKNLVLSLILLPMFMAPVIVGSSDASSRTHLTACTPTCCASSVSSRETCWGRQAPLCRP
ncbi:MAG TPA: hypothetical protein VK902_18560 [Rubrobacter sp.]|nr:hypothetical protein [Rubrobacter sp.]